FYGLGFGENAAREGLGTFEDFADHCFDRIRSALQSANNVTKAAGKPVQMYEQVPVDAGGSGLSALDRQAPVTLSHARKGLGNAASSPGFFLGHFGLFRSRSYG